MIGYHCLLQTISEKRSHLCSIVRQIVYISWLVDARVLLLYHARGGSIHFLEMIKYCGL